MFKTIQKKVFSYLKKRYEVKHKIDDTLYLSTQMGIEFERIYLSMEDEETGGLLFGKMTKDGILIDYILPVENTSENPKTEFSFEMKKYIKAIMELRKRGYQLIGEYHTHPSGNPNASRQDNLTMKAKADKLGGIYALMICTKTHDKKKGILLQSYKIYLYI